MKIALIALACGVLVAACGGQVEEMKKSIDAVEQLADKAEEMEKSANEAEQVYKERASKGDTVAMPYKDLQGYLPSSISGYKTEGDPSGSQQSMQGWSMSNAEQRFVSEAGNGAQIKVTITDLGGTEGAYGMMAIPLMMGISMEDDHQKTGTVNLDMAQTSGAATFNKETKSTSVLIGTRYRYMITMESNGAGEDHTQLLTDLGKDIAKKFDGK